VLDDGASGRLFRTGDSDALAAALDDALSDTARTAALRAHARAAVERYDWSTVAMRVLDVYTMVTGGGDGDSRSLLGRIFRGRA
jgi:phosphatidyl-myo-inositol alpha-mannosyltransferase